MSLRRKPSRDLVVAYHEAGHAVAAYALGVKVLSVSIDDREDSAGRLTHSARIGGDPSTSPTTDKMKCNAERQVIVILAGLESQRRHRPSSVPSYRKSAAYNIAADEHVAVGLLHHFVGDTKEIELWLPLLQYRARVLIENPAWWFVIEGLARVLITKRTLSGKEMVAEIQTLRAEYVARHRQSWRKEAPTK
jgi:hypothetical protein